MATPWFVLVERKNPGTLNAIGGDFIQSIYAPQNDAGAQFDMPGTGLPPVAAGAVFYLYKGAMGMLPWTALP